MPANQVVLSAFSPVLRNLLHDHPQQYPVLFMSGVQHQVLQCLLELMYLGRTKVNQERFTDFIELVSSLQIELPYCELEKPKTSSDNSKMSDDADDDILQSRKNNSFAIAIKAEVPDTHTKLESNHKLQHEGAHISVKCDQNCSNEGSPDIHKHGKVAAENLTNETDVKRKIMCTLCISSFSTEKAMKLHMKTIHGGAKYSCKQCSFITFQLGNLKRHQISKHEQRRYSCNLCDRTFTDKGHVRRHKMSKHEGVRYQCSKCEYRATLIADLKRHHQAKHESVRYPCDQCEYMTGWPEMLKKHKRKIHFT